MRTLFSTVLNMSLTASFVIIAVLAVRFLLRKAPRRFSYALWAVVLFRLLCPIALESPLSLLPTSQPLVAVEQAFDGSLPKFLAAFASRKKLSADEIEQLQRLIDESRR